MEQLEKILSNQMVEELEKSIKNFSKEYAETNETPYLLDSIYENKINEIVSLLLNKNSNYLIKQIKNGTIKIKELNPSKFDDIIKKRELSEIKKNVKQGLFFNIVEKSSLFDKVK